MKKILFWTVLNIFTIQLISAQKLELGIGLGYDMSINFDDNEDYVVSLPELANTTSILSLDVFTKIPIKNGFNIYPTVIFTISKGHFQLENLNGDFMPEGYTVQLPYTTPGNGWSVNHYSNQYEYFLSDAYVSQTSYGGYLTKNIGGYFEIGTGLFLKTKKYSIDNFNAYDEYIWEGEIGTQYDTYSYVETYDSSIPFEKETFVTSQISIPVIFQYNGSENSSLSYSFLTHISKDMYFGFHITYGFKFLK
mgnify:CR=1 FL=1